MGRLFSITVPPSWFVFPCRDSLPPRAPDCSSSLSKVTVWLAEPSATVAAAIAAAAAVAPPFGVGDAGSL